MRKLAGSCKPQVGQADKRLLPSGGVCEGVCGKVREGVWECVRITAQVGNGVQGWMRHAAQNRKDTQECASG